MAIKSDLGAIDVAWDEFLPWFLSSYRQDEHVSLLGPTKTGKTTLAREILEARECVIVIATKPEDPVVDKFQEYGYRIQETLDIPTVETEVDGETKRRPHRSYRRIVLWPRAERDRAGRWRNIDEMTAYQKAEITKAIEYARRSRRWTLFTDDVLSLAEDLRLGPDLKWYWRNGRSAGLTLVAASQRPAWVPREMYSAPEHLFFWQTRDKNDLERLADIGAGLDKKQLEAVITGLKRYEFLYLAPREHPPVLVKSKVDL